MAEGNPFPDTKCRDVATPRPQLLQEGLLGAVGWNFDKNGGDVVGDIGMSRELSSNTCRGSRAREDGSTVCDSRCHLPWTCSSDVQLNGSHVRDLISS